MQGEAGLPFRNPSSFRDLGGAFGASLRVCMGCRRRREDGLIRRAKPMLTLPLGEVQGEAGLPFRNPSSFRDLGGAFGASLRVCLGCRRHREDGLIRRTKPMLTLPLGLFLHEECKGRQASPSETPPPSGILGAPSAHPFGSVWGVGGVGKTDSYAGRSPCLRSRWERCKGRQASPSETPPLSGILGAPSAHPFGSVWGVGGTGKTDSYAGRSPCLRSRWVYSSMRNARGGRPPLPKPLLFPGSWGRLRRIPSGLPGVSAASGRRTHTQGEAHAYAPAGRDARGGRPPLPKPLLLRGSWGRLRRIPPGLPGVSAASGRRTHTQGEAHAYAPAGFIPP